MGKLMKKASSVLVAVGIFMTSVSACMSVAMASEAALEADSKVTISVLYSNDIKPENGDQFLVTYASEENPNAEQTITVNGYAHADEGMEVMLPSGSYSVLNIEYLGENAEIVGQGYCVQSVMYCTPSIPGTLAIGVGEDKIAELADGYGEGSLRIKDTDHTDSGEAYRPSYGTKYTAKDTPDVQPSDGRSDEQGYTVVKEGNAEGGDESVTENPVAVSGGSVGGYDDSGDVQVTDTGEGKTIIYADGDVIQDGLEHQEKEKYASIFRRLIGLAVIAASGFGIMFFLHKKGKI